MTAPPLRVLVVDDEPPIRKLLRMGLGTQEYRVIEAPDGRTALDLMREKPDLIILDLGLPDMEGLELLRTIRARNESVPIVVLSSRADEVAKVQALDLGADDYVTKPFSMPELEARVRVALRHYQSREASEGASVLQVGDLVVDISHHWVTVGGRLVELTPREFALLAFLARRPGRVLTHGAILAEVWGADGAGHVEYLRVYTRSLRRKLADDRANPRLVTEPGVGYRLIARP
ncbi:MAG TPA: response regulator transcription factor [Xanthobacteraceae bacterium]|nr:response regulator transcription factor [Xanthobacteraceae bacterium]